MKKFLFVFLFAFLVFALIGCKPEEKPSDTQPGDNEPSEPVTETFTVVLNSEGERFATLKVKSGEKITTKVDDPTKEGYSFVGWYEGDTLVNLSEYVVTKNVTFNAKFVKDDVDPSLDVNAKKEAGKTYTLVIGWWEVKDPDDPDKKTSYLTEELVQKFYANVNLYLKVKGLTEDEIKNVQVRNYSTKAVADMGALVNADADVDIMIGVGNNINSTAGVSLYEGSNDNKFATTMGTTPTSRYVALTSYATELGVNVYDWLATETGKTAFNVALKEADITIAPARTNDANVTVKVYVDDEHFEELVFETKDQELDLPLLEIDEDFELEGFAIVPGGEVVLRVANGGKLSYSQIKDLVIEGEDLVLYPIFSAITISEDDLVVLVQLNKGLNSTEANLLFERFYSSLDPEAHYSILFNFVEGDAATFTAEFEAQTCVDVVIGGNNPLKNFAAHADGPLANAGAKHFRDTSRKVIINANCQHLELAKALYDFVVADAPEFELHVTFWLNENKWITVDELATLKAGINDFFKEYFTLAEEENLADVYNVSITTYDCTSTKVADLAAETNALRDGKGTDIIIGCGANVTTTGGYTSALVKDIPTTMVAAERKVALITFNGLAHELFHGFFEVEPTPEA